MAILGIDPGTKCGWALLCNSMALKSGTWNLKPRKDNNRGRRYLNLWHELIRIDNGGMLDHIYYEEVVAHKGTHAAHVYGGLVAVLLLFAEERHLPTTPIPVGTIKKHATGNGRASKTDMVEAANRKWPEQNVIDDNQADALWILDCGMNNKETK